MLAARLKGMIEGMVRESQSMFIKGRNILYGWIMASEVLDGIKRARAGVIYKIDLKRHMTTLIENFFSLCFVR